MPQELAGSAPAGILCPVCGGQNPPDAVFCGNAGCHKALGEFAYVEELVREETKAFERLAERVTGFIGRPQFLLVHLAWFAAWILINSGLVMMVHQFDRYPFNLLGIMLSVEAIFITGFVLISQNRQSAFAGKRAELDYEVNVRTYREIQELKRLVTALGEHIAALEGPRPSGNRTDANVP